QRWTTGSVYCAGGNAYGQLGNGTNTSSSKLVAVLKNDGTPLSDVTAIGGGANHTCAITNTNWGDYSSNTQQIYCWGKNQYGQLGDNTTTNRNRAAFAYGGNPGESIGPVVGGLNHTCFTDHAGG